MGVGAGLYTGLRRFRYIWQFRYKGVDTFGTWRLRYIRHPFRYMCFLLYDFGTCEVHFGTSLCRYRYIARERQFIMLAVGKNARWML